MTDEQRKPTPRAQIERERQITRRTSGLNGSAMVVPRWLLVATVGAFGVLLALIVWSLIGVKLAGTARAELACRSDLTNRATIAEVAGQLAAEQLDPADFKGEVQRYARAHNVRTRRIVEETRDKLGTTPESCAGFVVELERYP